MVWVFFFFWSAHTGSDNADMITSLAGLGLHTIAEGNDSGKEEDGRKERKRSLTQRPPAPSICSLP